VALPRQDWQKARFLDFCAIGNPAAFFDDLSHWGFQVAQQRGFPDHLVYSAREAGELEHAAASCGSDALLCSEKDVWNLRNVQFTALPAYCCRISFDLPNDFWSTLADSVQGRKEEQAR
jgi:tetraacyldisaccharide-1-P 4'-kinase